MLLLIGAENADPNLALSRPEAIESLVCPNDTTSVDPTKAPHDTAKTGCESTNRVATHVSNRTLGQLSAPHVCIARTARIRTLHYTTIYA